jgi:hypothetical protein
MFLYYLHIDIFSFLALKTMNLLQRVQIVVHNNVVFLGYIVVLKRIDLCHLKRIRGVIYYPFTFESEIHTRFNKL